MNNFFRSFLIVLTISIFPGCKENPKLQTNTEGEFSALVVFLVGDIQYGDSKVRVGELLKPGKTLSIGKRSFVDLQFLNSGPGITIRVRENSLLEFHSEAIKNVSEYRFQLHRGESLFRITKLLKEMKVKVDTPNASMGVRGTEFLVRAGEFSEVQTLEGSLSIRPDHPVLQRFSPEISKESKLLSSANRILSTSELILDSGKRVRITDEERDKILENGNLKSILDNEQVEEILRQELQSPDPISHAGDLDSLGTISELKEDSVKSILKTGSLTPEEKKSLEKEYSELKELPRDTLKSLSESDLKESVLAFNQKREKELKKKIESFFGKNSEILILKDGRKIEGIILEEGERVFALTPEGKLEFDKSEIDSQEMLKK